MSNIKPITSNLHFISSFISLIVSPSFGVGSRRLKCSRSTRVQSFLKDFTISRIIQVSSVSSFWSPSGKRQVVSVSEALKASSKGQDLDSPGIWIWWLFLRRAHHNPLTLLSAISTRHFPNFAHTCVQSCLTLCDPTDCSPPGSSVHGISQARILEWVTISSSRGSSRPRDWTRISYVSCVAGGLFTVETPEKPFLDVTLL